MDRIREIYQLQTKCSYKQDWVDSRLSWTPDKFGGLQFVMLPPEKIWKPDMMLQNR